MSKKKAEWYYFRKGWTTCAKASRFLEASQIEIVEQVPASRKLHADDARKLLEDASTLIAAKGKKLDRFDVSKSVSSDAVEAMLGPTGNLRSPTIQVGKTLLVGFNEDAFAETFD